MRTTLCLLALTFLVNCGSNGPESALSEGISPCKQLRQCICDPDNTADVDACNQSIDDLEATSNDPLATCKAQLASNTGLCGEPLEVNGSVL